MTNDETIKLKMQREQHEHEMKMALINAFAKDPELKYFVGIAVGAGVAGVSAIFGQITDSHPGYHYEKRGVADASGGIHYEYVLVPNQTGGDNSDQFPTWGWLAAASVVSPGGVFTNAGLAAISGWLLGTDKLDDMGWPDTAAGILTLGATGFAGFCASVLLLKAIFGKEGATGLLGSLTGAVV